MHVAMVRNLPHHAVDHEIVVAIFDSRDQRERFAHHRTFSVGASRSMLSENSHRRVARVAVQDSKAERISELAVAESVFAQLAEFAISH